MKTKQNQEILYIPRLFFRQNFEWSFNKVYLRGPIYVEVLSRKATPDLYPFFAIGYMHNLKLLDYPNSPVVYWIDTNNLMLKRKQKVVLGFKRKNGSLIPTCWEKIDDTGWKGFRRTLLGKARRWSQSKKYALARSLLFFRRCFGLGFNSQPLH